MWLLTKLQRIIFRALEWEREHPDKRGWTLNDVEAHPAELIRLIREGKVEVVGENAYRRRLYRIKR
ncbi:MAG: hypothetical protein ACE5OY_08545 [Candidatus Bathyarchaeia archaeon]